MKRRDALSVLSAIVGGTFVGPQLLLSGCQAEADAVTYKFFTPEEITLLEQIAETILPATADSPGAKAANIGAFMDIFVADCFDPEEQVALREGLTLLDQRCQELDGKGFLKLQAAQQQDLLVTLDIEAETYQQQLQPGATSHYFSMIKYLTVLGYFTSEPGATQALRYLPVPGKYEGNIAWKPGVKAWAT